MCVLVLPVTMNELYIIYTEAKLERSTSTIAFAEWGGRFRPPPPSPSPSPFQGLLGTVQGALGTRQKHAGYNKRHRQRSSPFFGGAAMQGKA